MLLTLKSLCACLSMVNLALDASLVSLSVSNGGGFTYTTNGFTSEFFNTFSACHNKVNSLLLVLLTLYSNDIQRTIKIDSHTYTYVLLLYIRNHFCFTEETLFHFSQGTYDFDMALLTCSIKVKSNFLS